MKTDPNAPPSAPGSPFGHAQFLFLFGSLTLNNLVTWVHFVAAALLMTLMTSSPLMVALVQTAVTLPAFIFSAHAGALSDIVDRRRIVLITQVALIFCLSAVLGLSLAGMLTPWSLLALTFFLGSALAIGMPAWITAGPDAVPREMRLQAVGLTTVSYNAARAVGPALAGVVIAFGGPALVFSVTLVTAVAVLLMLLRRFPASPPVASATESVTAALRTGVRYARHASFLHTCFGRTVLFVINGSALWALLPVLAKGMDGHSTEAAYAWMLGSMGFGAVVAGLILGRLRALGSLAKVVSAAATVFAVASVVAASVQSLWLVEVVLFLAGAGWVCHSSTVMAAIQTSLPLWVRSRVLALQMLLFQGSMALGSAFWGAVADFSGVQLALIMSAALTVVAQLMSVRWPLRMGEESETTPAGSLPEVPTAWAPPPHVGPVAVEIEYLVVPQHEGDFVRRAHLIGRRRLRDGARHWRLYRDLDSRPRLIERFVVDSWEDYLRHRERSTIADHEAEVALMDWLQEGTQPKIRHFVDERMPSSV